MIMSGMTSLNGSQRAEGAETTAGGVHSRSSSSEQGPGPGSAAGPGLAPGQGPGLAPAQAQGPVKMSSLVARPHHIPKMNDGLAKRMEEIRKTMGGDLNGMSSSSTLIY